MPRTTRISAGDFSLENPLSILDTTKMMLEYSCCVLSAACFAERRPREPLRRTQNEVRSPRYGKWLS
jgi:hypothetical protein